MKVKLAISVLLVLLVATTICSSVRADVIPTPQSLLLELKETVLEADDWIFEGYIVTFTRQRKNALANKIDATIGLFDLTDTEEAADKLVDDIRPKLTDPWDWHVDGASKRARSWLQLYPYDSDQWRAVTDFAAVCQGLIGRICRRLPPGRGIVEYEPSHAWWFGPGHVEPPVTLSLFFKSYRPFTVTVFNISYELWHNGELASSGTWKYHMDFLPWKTGTVPPYQEVTIYSTGVAYSWCGDFVLQVVFHTSVGDFPASGELELTPG